jgi:hypothetical protein
MVAKTAAVMSIVMRMELVGCSGSDGSDGGVDTAGGGNSEECGAYAISSAWMVLAFFPGRRAGPGNIDVCREGDTGRKGGDEGKNQRRPLLPPRTTNCPPPPADEDKQALKWAHHHLPYENGSACLLLVFFPAPQQSQQPARQGALVPPPSLGLLCGLGLLRGEGRDCVVWGF